MKIGIVTFHNSFNYGAVLQCYALVETFKRLGHEVKIINLHNPRISDTYIYHFWRHENNMYLNLKETISCLILRKGIKRENCFKKFINLFPLTRQYEIGDEIDEDFDCLVCGSDQVWNTKIIGERAIIYYFLDFGHPLKRISYAASSGSNRFADGNENFFKGILSKFDKIGVREFFLKKYLRESLDLDACFTPDPTSLLEMNDWLKIEEPVSRIHSDYLLFYTVNGYFDFYKDLIMQISKSLNLPIVYIDNERSLRFKRNVIDLSEVSPGQFLWLIRNAKFVVTDSFHGNMFSIIFRKAFCHVSCLNGKDERISSLHNYVGLDDTRIISSYEDFEKKICGNIDPIYNEDKIKSFVKQGLDFLNTICV